MEALALRILNIPLFAPLKRFAFRLALDLRNGRGRRGAERALRRAVRTSARASGPVDNWNRETLVAAASISRSRAAREYVFRLLSRRGNFVSAQVVANQRPFEAYSLEMQVSIIRNGFNGTDGVRSDERLTSFVAQNLASIGGLPLSVLKEFLYALRFSMLPRDLKFQTLESLSADLPITGPRRLALTAATIEINRGFGLEAFAPEVVVSALSNPRPTNSDVDLVRAYWSTSADRYDRDLLVRFLTAALSNPAVSIRHTPFLCRSLTDQEILSAISRQDLFARLEELPQAFSFRTIQGVSGLSSEIHSRAADYWFSNKQKDGLSKYLTASPDVRNQIIQILLRQDQFDLIRQLTDIHNYSDTLLDVLMARCVLAFEENDYSTALVIAKTVLRENPNHSGAWMLMRWASVRAVGQLDAVDELRREIGRGAVQSGRATVNRYFDDDAVLTSRQWQGDFLRVPLSSINKAWREVETRYNSRWFDFSRFPRDAPDKDLLAFPIFGVSDEVREAYHYGELAERYKSVTIVCDPRLEDLFVRSFPAITFVPFARSMKTQHLGDGRVNSITEVPPILSKYLPDSTRELLESESTVFTTTQNFVNKRLADRSFALRDGRYLGVESDRASKPGKEKLRVGILWRSHVQSGIRKYMYLDVSEITPVLGVPGVEFVSIQHGLSSTEEETLREHNVTIPAIDLFSDFVGLENLINTLDLVVGVSTLPVELAAALGCPVWMLGFSPENYYLRTLGGTTTLDVLTANSQIVSPEIPRFSEPREESVRRTIDRAMSMLASLVRRTE